MRLGAVVLAAGESRRMGSPKPLLRHGQRTFLELIVDGMRAASPQTIIIVTSDALRERIQALKLNDVSLTINHHPERGMAESLRCGLRALGEVDATLIALADHPRVSQSTVAALGEAARRHPERIIRPVLQTKSGHPVIIPSSLFRDVFDLTPGLGLNSIIERNRDLILDVEVDDPGVLIDIDTPRDFDNHIKGN